MLVKSPLSMSFFLTHTLVYLIFGTTLYQNTTCSSCVTITAFLHPPTYFFFAPRLHSSDFSTWRTIKGELLGEGLMFSPSKTMDKRNLCTRIKITLFTIADWREFGAEVGWGRHLRFRETVVRTF